jgi:hypothetical protein
MKLVLTCATNCTVSSTDTPSLACVGVYFGAYATPILNCSNVVFTSYT